jgi:hypothetical protein
LIQVAIEKYDILKCRSEKHDILKKLLNGLVKITMRREEREERKEGKKIPRRYTEAPIQHKQYHQKDFVKQIQQHQERLPLVTKDLKGILKLQL